MSLLDKIKKHVGDAIDHLFKVGAPASIDFRNETGEAIHVVMDNNREAHDIAPHGQATFSEAKIGDAPTFRIKNAAGQEVFNRRVNPITVPHASLGWNGHSF